MSKPPNQTDRRAQRSSGELREVSRVFLLSPANAAGIRAELVMHESRNSEMAVRLRQNDVPLGELFTFMSSLYFWGKMTCARAFAMAPSGLSGAYVITASGGLVAPDTVVTLDRLREICGGNVDPADPRYRTPLDRDARILCEQARRTVQSSCSESSQPRSMLILCLRSSANASCFPQNSLVVAT